MSKVLIFILTALVLGLAIYSPNIVRLYKLANLYNEKTIAKNFISINKIFSNTSSPIPASDEPHIFEKIEFDLPSKYIFEAEELDLKEGLAHFHTDGLIILHDGKMLFDYFTRTRAIRRGILEAGQDIEASDFGRSLVEKSKND